MQDKILLYKLCSKENHTSHAKKVSLTYKESSDLEIERRVCLE